MCACVLVGRLFFAHNAQLRPRRLSDILVSVNFLKLSKFAVQLGLNPVDSILACVNTDNGQTDGAARSENFTESQGQHKNALVSTLRQCVLRSMLRTNASQSSRVFVYSYVWRVWVEHVT